MNFTCSVMITFLIITIIGKHCWCISSDDDCVNELKTTLKLDITRHKNFDLLPRISQCGSFPLNRRFRRIVGGRPSGLGTYGFVVRIYRQNSISGNKTFHCGGSVINSRYILTAAHCVMNLQAGYFLSPIMIGTYDSRLSIECIGKLNCEIKKFVEIESSIPHEEYVIGSNQNDIALLRVSRPILFDNFLQPVCLPYSEQLIDGWKDSELTAVGLGGITQDSLYTANDEKLSPIIQEVNVALQPRETCDRFYSRYQGILDERNLCAGGDYGKGVCHGDSGGPLVKAVSIQQIIGKKIFQFGIISSGRCGLQGIPNIYTNMLYYMPWILNHLKP